MSSPPNLSCSAPFHICLHDLRGLPQVDRPSLHLSAASRTETTCAVCIYDNKCLHCCPQLAQPALLCPAPAHSTPGRRLRPRRRPPRAAASGGAWAAANPGAASERKHLTSPFYDVQPAAQCLCFCEWTLLLCAKPFHGLLDSSLPDLSACPFERPSWLTVSSAPQDGQGERARSGGRAQAGALPREARLQCALRQGAPGGRAAPAAHPRGTPSCPTLPSFE